MRARLKFGQILLEAGVITESDLKTALAAQFKNGLALGRILEDWGLISDRDIVDILARQFNLPIIDTIDDPPDPESLLDTIDCDNALKKMIFPLRIRNSGVEVAVSNPLDFNTLDRLAFKTGHNIKPVLATPTAIFKAIKRFYLKEQETEANRGSYLLIIDDHDLYRSTICSNLKRCGYVPFFAVTVEEAIRIAQKSSPRLILVDTCMEGISGQMTYEQLQQNDCTSRCPILALTANKTAEEEAFLLRLGYFDVINKPLNYTRLEARIERSLHFYYHRAASLFPSADRQEHSFAVA